MKEKKSSEDRDAILIFAQPGHILTEEDTFHLYYETFRHTPYARQLQKIEKERGFKDMFWTFTEHLRTCMGCSLI